jgi:hypothetical protein
VKSFILVCRPYLDWLRWILAAYIAVVRWSTHSSTLKLTNTMLLPLWMELLKQLLDKRYMCDSSCQTPRAQFCFGPRQCRAHLGTIYSTCMPVSWRPKYSRKFIIMVMYVIAVAEIHFFRGGAKPPKFPTKLSNFRHAPHLHSKRLFLALF